MHVSYEVGGFKKDVYPAEEVLKVIRLYELDIENRKTVVKQPHLVTVRSCESKLDTDGNPVAFYKNIDLKSIISITRLSDGVQSKAKNSKDDK